MAKTNENRGAAPPNRKLVLDFFKSSGLHYHLLSRYSLKNYRKHGKFSMVSGIHYTSFEKSRAISLFRCEKFGIFTLARCKDSAVQLCSDDFIKDATVMSTFLLPYSLAFHLLAPFFLCSVIQHYTIGGNLHV